MTIQVFFGVPRVFGMPPKSSLGLCNLDKEQILALITGQIQVLTWEQIRRLTVEQMRWLSEGSASGADNDGADSGADNDGVD